MRSVRRRRLRAALYHRVSTREQNPRLARAELRAAGAARGLRVVLEVEETASGKSSVRPGLARVLGAAERGAIDVVLVQRLDRWGRSTLDLLANLRRLRSAGVGFVAVAQGLEVRPEHDAVSELTLTVLAAVAEFERAVIVERTLDGLAAAPARRWDARSARARRRPSVSRRCAPPAIRGPRSRAGSAARSARRGGPSIGACRNRVAREATPLRREAPPVTRAAGTDRFRSGAGQQQCGGLAGRELGVRGDDPIG